MRKKTKKTVNSTSHSKNRFLFVLALCAAIIGAILMLYNSGFAAGYKAIATPTPKVPEQAGYIEDSYYVMPLLNIRMRPEEELLQQKITSAFEYDSSTYTYSVRFSTEAIEALAEECSAARSGIAHIWKGEGKYENYPSNMLLKQFKTFFIAQYAPGYDCTFEDSDKAKVDKLIEKATEAFDKSLKTVEEIK